MAKILIIVEGAKIDVKLMTHLLKTYNISDEHNIISYNANLYSLFNQMFKQGNPEDLDLLQLLKEHERNDEKKKIFDIKYSDVLLIFDLDPQDPQFSYEKVLQMLYYFNESSDKGKLYINYPMVEAFYHMRSIPDDDFNLYYASMDELQNKEYKTRVQKESRDNDYRKFAINKEECNTVIRQNYEKAIRICGRPYEGISHFINDKELLTKQVDLLENDKKLYVVCTCAFYILDYDSKLLSD